MQDNLQSILLGKDWFGGIQSLYNSNQLTPNSSRSIARFLIESGRRRKAKKFLAFIRKTSLYSSDYLIQDINNLLALGREKEAKSFFDSSDQSTLPASYCERLERFFASSSLISVADDFEQLARGLLLLDFEQDLASTGSGYLDGLKGRRFSDIVVVSNSAGLVFDDDERRHLKSMQAPLFVYINIGNPALRDQRASFYADSACELLIGNATFLVDDEMRLLFQPWDPDRFLGCWVLARRRMLIDWYQTLCGQVTAANPGVVFSHLRPLIALQSAYPLTVYRDARGDLKQRIPTAGCLALMLASALCSFVGKGNNPDFVRDSCRVWSAGFSMSASYIFEACAGSEWHDYVFERVLQQRLSESGWLQSIGRIDSMAPEKTAAQHLQAQNIAVPRRRSGFDQARSWET